MDDYFDLGDFHWEISTRSAEAQQWFNRGMVWCFAFHHEEAVECFHQVIHYDPSCAMGYWGHAYAAGPNYNLPWELSCAATQVERMAELHACLAEAYQRAGSASPLEQALIAALRGRIQAGHVVDEATYGSWDDDYAAAMRAVYSRFPDDINVACLTAEALMCRTPWQLWDLERGIPAPGADTLEAIEILEKALARIDRGEAPPHPGLLHLYIHALEMSPRPERALAASDQLLNLVPEAGHLIHMPSHIYILCSQYEKALEANTRAIIADNKYGAYNDAICMYTLYRAHNYHFKAYAAMFLGRFEPALEAAEEMLTILPRPAITHEHEYLASTLEGYRSIKAHVLIRFGRWRETIAEPLPAEPDVYRFTTAIWHYAKGVAHAALGEVEAAAAEQRHFQAAYAKVSEERLLFNNNARDILDVAAAMLAGELAYRQGEYEAAFAHLRQSVARYDKLLFTEPWAWMQPTRHALGALLLEQNHVAEAAAVYRADLGLDDTCIRPAQHHDNIWSLFGYADCLRQLGKTDELALIQTKLDRALALKDVAVHASCYCKMKETNGN